MSYSLLYHTKVKDDVEKIDKTTKKRISRAITTKLITEPYRFGKPLQYSLKGARTLRVGDFRVIYQIQDEEILVLAIVHRRDNYENLTERITWKTR